MSDPLSWTWAERIIHTPTLIVHADGRRLRIVGELPEAEHLLPRIGPLG